MSNADILDAVLAEEGRFANSPLDSGGATNWGITQGTLAWYRGQPVSVADVQALTEDEARAIYLKQYLLGPGFDKIADPLLRWQLVDFGVNSGPAIAIQRLQEVLRTTVIDGILGPETVKAANEAPDPVAVGNALAKARLRLLVGIAVKRQSPYWLGWLSRACKFIRP